MKWAAETKTPVFGMVECCGRVRAMVIADNAGQTLQDRIGEHVLPESMIFTDEYKGYWGLDRKFKGHRRIMHRERIYVRGDVHTNTWKDPVLRSTDGGSRVVVAPGTVGSLPDGSPAGRRARRASRRLAIRPAASRRPLGHAACSWVLWAANAVGVRISREE